MPASQRYLTLALAPPAAGRRLAAEPESESGPEPRFFSCHALSLYLLLQLAKAETGRHLEPDSTCRVAPREALRQVLPAVRALCRRRSLAAVLLAVDLAKQAEAVRREIDTPLDQGDAAAAAAEAEAEADEESFSSPRSSYVPRALEAAVDGLVVLALRAADQLDAENSNALVSFSADVDAAPANELVAVLLDLLKTQDGAAGNWALHAAALQRALGHAGGGQPVLLEALLAACDDKLAWLLRFLVSAGHLALACSTAQRLLASVDHAAASQKGAGRPQWVPYTALDDLILSCRQSTRACDRDALQALELALEQHFRAAVTAL